MSTAAHLRDAALLQAEIGSFQVIQCARESPPMVEYEGRPDLYAEKVLGIQFWDKIGEILRSVERPPYGTLVKSGHKVGKTHGAAALINYWFDVYDPGVVITTGASYEAMKDTVWGEVRMQRMRAGRPDHFIGPVAPAMKTSEEHWAKLFSVNDSTSFQGKHRSRMLFLFDEAVGVEKAMWTVAKTMHKREPGYGWICFYNPTDPSCQVYAEEQATDYRGRPKWQIYNLSSLDHPNIVQQRAARARGEELLSRDLDIPSAISITQIDDWVRDWCLPIDPISALATDFEWIWPDGTRNWWRPQMDWEARCTGNWPSSATASVWSDYLFTQVQRRSAGVPLHMLPELGVDVARFGDDDTCKHARWDCLSLQHHSRKGMSIPETAGWTIESADALADMVNRLRKNERLGRPMVQGRQIPIKVDDDGVGGGVVDLLREAGYNVVAIGAQTAPVDPAHYPNKRSELWFASARRAIDGRMAFCEIGSDGVSRCQLDTDAVARLKLQAMAPLWKLNAQGQRTVEKKEETKRRLGRSPDDMDALNLAYYECSVDAPQAIQNPTYDDEHLGPQSSDDWEDPQSKRPRRRLFGH